jgi:hypothetical protein
VARSAQRHKIWSSTIAAYCSAKSETFTIDPQRCELKRKRQNAATHAGIGRVRRGVQTGSSLYRTQRMISSISEIDDDITRGLHSIQGITVSRTRLLACACG